jgi:hypothetical protein
MKRNVVVIVVVVLGLLWARGASAEMKEGFWEITSKVEMKGMPSNMPPTIVKQCITKKDAVPQPKAQNQECKMKDQKVSGDTVTYAMECKMKDGTMETSGRMNFKGDRFDGSTTTTVKTKDQPAMQMSSTMSGKYLGPCPK